MPWPPGRIRGAAMRYRKEIDGLRALAVIPVILFHAGFDAFSGGFVGVDIFFVISGYLITSIILSEVEDGRFTLTGFYERRARRILPALFFVMLVCLPFAYLWMLPDQLEEFSRSVTAVSAFVSNFLFFTESGYFQSAAELKPLLHTWSLAVEEQFYVVFPLFILCFWRRGKRQLVTLISIVAMVSMFCAQLAGNFNFSAPYVESDWQWFSQPSWASFYLPIGRAWELMLGALSAFYLQSNPHPTWKFRHWADGFGLVMIVYAIFAFDQSTPFPSIYTLVPTLGTTLIILCATSTAGVGKLLSLRIFVAVGLISYSAYLFHQPLFAFARIRSIDEPGALTFLVLGGIALALGYLSWRFIERPFRDRRKIPRATIFLAATVISVLMIGVGLIGHFGEGFTGRFNKNVNRVLATGDNWSALPDSCDPGKGAYTAPSDRCTVGAKRKPSIAIIGDSHARAVASTLGAYAEKLGLSAKVLVHSGCIPVRGLRRLNKPRDTCPRNNEDTYNFLAESHEIEYVILMARWTLAIEETRFDDGEGGRESGAPNYLIDVNALELAKEKEARRSQISKRYQESIQEFLLLGRTVLLIYPVPEIGWRVKERLVRLAMFSVKSERPLSTSYSVFLSRNMESYKMLDAVGEMPNLIRIKPADMLCNTFVENRCVAELDGVPLYLDHDHLTEVGASILAKQIFKVIESRAE